MAKPLILSLDGQEFPVSITKIDREKLYGAIEIEAFDENGNDASLKVLAPDGKTLIDKGGTALATVNEDGESIERGSLKAVGPDGEEIEPVPSSFGRVNVLKPADSDEYLGQIVKSVYLVQPFEESSLDYLQDHLAADQIYKFPFSYRGGLEFDSAYVIGADDAAFLVVGRQAAFQFLKLNQAAVLDSEEEQEISADDIDFDLM
jgi:hypothetical protein